MPGKELSLQIKIAGKVDSSLKSALGTISSGIGGAVKVMGTLATAGVAAVGAIGAASVKVGKEFESSMSNLAATSGLDLASEEGQAAYSQLEAAAREMGKATTKTASEAADALNYMALAGWDVNTSCQALEPVLRLSEATGLDLATTSDLVTDSMSAMGVTVDELSTYLDVCAAANNSSNQSAEQLMEAMIGCGGAARTAGMDFQDTATALGILANNGIKGSEAGTALNSMLVRISTNSTAAAAFEEIGVAVYDTEGNMRNFQDILVDTSAALDGMTDAEKNNYMSAIAGKNYYSDFQYLLNGVSDAVDGQGSSWEQLTAQLDNSQGALQAMAETKTDNLEGDISRLTSAASDLGISIYKGINGPMREVTQTATNMMSELSAAFDEGGFSGFAGALGGCLSEGVEMIASYAPTLIDSGVQVVSSFIQGIGDNAPQVAASAAGILTSFVQGIFTLLPQVGTVGIQVILEFAQAIIAQAPMLFQAATTGIVNFINGLGQNLPAIIQTGIQLIIALIQGILTSLPQIIAAGIQLVGELINTILHTNWIEVGGEILSSIGQGLLGGVKSIGSSIVNGVKGLFGGGNADVSEEGAEATESYAAGIEANASVVSDAASSMTATAFADMDFSGLTDAGAQSMETFSLALTDNIPLVTTAADDMTTEAFAGMDFSILEDAGLSSMETYSEALTSNAELVTSAVEDMSDDIVDSLDQGWNTAQSSTETAMKNMTSTCQSEAQAAANAIKNAFEGMTIVIPKPKIPVITTSYRTETYGDGGSIQIPQFNVSWNALGGILDDPTILNTAQGLQGVGEAGPEAILPLDTLWEQMRDIMADLLRNGSGEGVVEMLLNRLQGSGGGSLEYAGAGSMNVTYAPVYNLNGTATREDAVEAERMSQAEFSRMMRDWERDNNRRKL